MSNFVSPVLDSRWYKKVGLTTTEALVALTIGAIVLGGFAIQHRNTSHGTQTFKGHLAFDNLKASVQQILQKESLCKSAFRNASSSLAKFDLSSMPTSDLSLI